MSLAPAIPLATASSWPSHRRTSREHGRLRRDALGSNAAEQFDLFASGLLRAAIREVDDVPLTLTFDRGVRLLDEACHSLRQPVVAPCLPAIAIHALLNDRPASFIADNVAVQIKVEPS